MTAERSARFGVVVVGDEILTGKRVDRHLGKAIELLAERGLELSWARYLGDDAAELTRQLAETMAGDAIVLCFGGIGGTPDDRTRQAAAAAAGVELALHPEGWRLLVERFGEQDAQPRRAMVEFPAGASLIPNPVNRIPGFSLGRHHFVPGFPNMAWPMAAWVLDALYPALHARGRRADWARRVLGVRESEITPLLERWSARYPALRLSCLPRWCPPEFELELGLRGEPAALAVASAEVLADLDAAGYRHEPVPAGDTGQR